MKQAVMNLNRQLCEREVFARVMFRTEPRYGEWLEIGTYSGKVDQISLLEDTVAALKDEIHRLQCK